MFKQIKYKVLYVELQENGTSLWIEKDVVAARFDGISITHVTVRDGEGESAVDREIVIDNVSSFIQESTTLFDKSGIQIYGADVVKVSVSTGPEGIRDIVCPISWVNGGWHFIVEELEQSILLDQANTRAMEKLGNIYQHGEVLESYRKQVDEKVFEKKDGEEEKND